MADPVTLDELKTHLNLSAASDESDAELTLHLRAATRAIEKRIGPLVIQEFTERLTANSSGVMLVSNMPLVAVVSATSVVGNTAVLQALDVDPAGVISGASSRLATGRYDVTYTAGHGATASEDHKLAVLYVAEHLWEMQQQTGVGDRPGLFGEDPPGGEESARYIYRGFALPRRALELISGDEQLAIG